MAAPQSMLAELATPRNAFDFMHNSGSMSGTGFPSPPSRDGRAPQTRRRRITLVQFARPSSPAVLTRASCASAAMRRLRLLIASLLLARRRQRSRRREPQGRRRCQLGREFRDSSGITRDRAVGGRWLCGAWGRAQRQVCTHSY